MTDDCRTLIPGLLLPVMIAAALLGGCGDGELEPIVDSGAGGDSDSDTDSDADSDADSDSDSDSDADTDTATGTDAACPFNSGYPCACDGSSALCEDGTDCVMVGSKDVGACMVACGQFDTPIVDCADTGAFGTQTPAPSGRCGFNVDNPIFSGAGDWTHCMVICADKGNSGSCPPGLNCVPHPDPRHHYKICLPPL